MTDDRPTRTVVHVALGDRSYDIVITSGELPAFADTFRFWATPTGDGRKVVLVSDENVRTHAEVVSQSLEAAGWRADLCLIPPGESSKSLAVISDLYDRMVDLQADRRTTVVAIGGGVVGDTAGFLAATYLRGLPFVQVPTTLLADVDSSVGGKVGINHPRGKNLIGAFHQPVGVFIDTAVLQTLPDREYRAGLAEVIKYGVILDAEFFAFLEQHTVELNQRDPHTLRQAIARSCRLKANVVQQDEREITGLRAVLNYGHTFAHAFEALAGYGELLHGEAVAIGMVHASRLAERRELISPDITERQVRLLEAVGLAIRLPGTAGWSADDVLDRMRLDKKTIGGRLRFVLPTQLGHVEMFDDVPEEDVRAVL